MCCVRSRRNLWRVSAVGRNIDPHPLRRRIVTSQERSSDDLLLSHDMYRHQSAYFTMTVQSRKGNLPIQLLASDAVALLPRETESPRRLGAGGSNGTSRPLELLKP